jgi:DNA binding domain, excisionase family
MADLRAGSAQAAPREDQMPETASACLSAREAAAFLHLNEKKLYELANSRELPAARIGGKWLFPRALLEEWLLEQAHGGALTDRLLITGSDDPLLSATVAALAPALGAEAFVAYSPTGTLAGLELLARRRANVCALHWGGVEHSVQQHAMLLRRFGPHRKWALVRLALREQGGDPAPRPAGGGHRDARRLRLSLGDAPARRGLGALPRIRARQPRLLRRRLQRGGRGAHRARGGGADCARGRRLRPGHARGGGEFGLGFLSLGWRPSTLRCRARSCSAACSRTCSPPTAICARRRWPAAWAATT